MPLDIGKVLRDQIQFVGLTYEDVADALNLNRNTVYSWTSSKRTPTLDNLYQLCLLLDITIDDIIYWAGYDYDRPALRVVPFGSFEPLDLGLDEEGYQD